MFPMFHMSHFYYYTTAVNIVLVVAKNCYLVTDSFSFKRGVSYVHIRKLFTATFFPT